MRANVPNWCHTEMIGCSLRQPQSTSGQRPLLEPRWTAGQTEFTSWLIISRPKIDFNVYPHFSGVVLARIVLLSDPSTRGFASPSLLFLFFSSSDVDVYDVCLSSHLHSSTAAAPALPTSLNFNHVDTSWMFDSTHTHTLMRLASFALYESTFCSREWVWN